MLTGLEMDVDWLLIGFDWILLDVDLIILFTFFFSLDATLSLGIKIIRSDLDVQEWCPSCTQVEPCSKFVLLL